MRRARPMTALLALAVLPVVLAACVVAAPTPAPGAPAPVPAAEAPTGALAPELTFPIRAAFYYQWFPEGWQQDGTVPYTRYTPSLGTYDSSDEATIRAQVAAMRHGDIRAALASWWGPGQKSEQQRVPALLAGAASADLRVGLYYEKEGIGNPPVAELRRDLQYIATRYGHSPDYLRVGGRPVLFVYSADDTDCSVTDRWRAADPERAFYVVMKVFPGYGNCPAQPDGWHQYEPSKAVSPVPAGPAAAGSYNISPGFWHAERAAPPAAAEPYLARDLDRWRRSIRAMTASGARWQLVTSFNEWGEGTSVESAVQWSSPSGNGSYLDVLHTDGR